MKHFCIILLTLIAITASAQKKIGIAVKLGGGLGNESIRNSEILSSASTGAFNFGGMAIFRLKKQWEIQAGLEVASKGAFITEDAITTDQHPVYLDIPVSLVRNFNIRGLGAYYLGGGVYGARAIGGNSTFQTPNSQTSAAITYGNNEDLQRYDAGLNFTTGLKLNNKLLFDISYQLGLANLTTTPLKDTGTSAIKSRLVTVSLGYLFR